MNGEGTRTGFPVRHIVVVTGPSGVGKDTVLRALFAIDPGRLTYCVSYTTRRPRPGERDGVDYWFIDEARFRAMIGRGEFFEWSTVYGELKGRTFAGIEDAVRSGRTPVIKIDVQGADKVRARLGDDAVYIFILPPSLDALQQRLEERATDSGASMRLRHETAAVELAARDAYDHQVVNDDPVRAAWEIHDIIGRECERGVRRG